MPRTQGAETQLVGQRLQLRRERGGHDGGGRIRHAQRGEVDANQVARRKEAQLSGIGGCEITTAGHGDVATIADRMQIRGQCVQTGAARVGHGAAQERREGAAQLGEVDVTRGAAHVQRGLRPVGQKIGRAARERGRPQRRGIDHSRHRHAGTTGYAHLGVAHAEEQAKRRAREIPAGAGAHGAARAQVTGITRDVEHAAIHIIGRIHLQRAATVECNAAPVVGHNSAVCGSGGKLGNIMTSTHPQVAPAQRPQVPPKLRHIGPPAYRFVRVTQAREPTRDALHHRRAHDVAQCPDVDRAAAGRKARAIAEDAVLRRYGRESAADDYIARSRKLQVPGAGAQLHSRCQRQIRRRAFIQRQRVSR